MTDYAHLKEYLESRERGIIEPGRLIRFDTLEYIRKNISLTPSLVVVYPRGNKGRRNDPSGGKYHVEYRCPHCYKVVSEDVKTEKLKLLFHKKYNNSDPRFFCKECLKRHNEEEEHKKSQQEALMAAFSSKTRYRRIPYISGFNGALDFIKDYLDVDYANISCAVAEEFIMRASELSAKDNEIVSMFIKGINYSDYFLQTKYWHAIAFNVKNRFGFRCALCGSDIGLCVHHRDYKCHGLEHIFWESELICLCAKCHEKFHNK